MRRRVPPPSAGALVPLLVWAISCTSLDGLSGGADAAPSDDGGTPSDDGGAPAVPCVDTTSSSEHCGRCGHSCFGDPCSAGACVPTRLASVTDGHPTGIAVDATSAYFGVASLDSATTRPSLAKVPKDALEAQPEKLLVPTTRWYPAQVIADAPYVMVVSSASGGGDATIFRVNGAGGNEIPLGGACTIDDNRGLAADDTHAYVVNERVRQAYRILKSSGACQSIATFPGAPSQIAVDSTQLYVATSAGIVSLPKGGGAQTPLAVAEVPAAWGVVVDGSQLFTSTSDGRIVAMNKDGSGAVVLAKNQAQPTGLVVDATRVYWANTLGGEIWSVGRAGGEAVLLASGQTGARWIAMDERRVYWTASTAVMRVAK